MDNSRSNPAIRQIQQRKILLYTGLILFLLFISATASAAEWVPTGSLNFAHNDYEAIRLNDGRVLVGAEIYDPATGIWSLTGPMVFGNVFSTFDLLNDGRVLVTGQHDYWYNPPAPYAQIYDPGTDSWTATTNMSKGRSTSLSITLADGRVLIAGGLGGDTSVEIYNPGTQNWSTTASMNEGHTKGSMVLLKDGRVLVSGGTNDMFDSTRTASTEIYDAATGRWAFTGSMPTAVSEHPSVVLVDGRVLTVKGASGYLYNPATSTWSSTAALTNLYNGNSLTRLADGKVLAAGSLDFGGTLGNTAEVYDPATNAWTSISNLPETRGRHAAALLNNGNVLLAGGTQTIPTCCDTTTAVLYTPGTAGVPPVPPPAASPLYLHIGDLDGSTSSPTASSWLATVTFTVLDENNQAVSGVAVSGLWSGGYQGNSIICLTNKNGQCDTSTAGYLSMSTDAIETLTVSNLQINDPSRPAMSYDFSANTDPDGDSNGTTIDVLAPPAPAPPTPPAPIISTLHISDLDGVSTKKGSRRWRATVTIRVSDNSSSLVANAKVIGRWSNGSSGSAECTTNSSGLCNVRSDKIKNKKRSVRFTVTDVAHKSLNYTSADNSDPDGDSTGSQITVVKP